MKNKITTILILYIFSLIVLSVSASREDALPGQSVYASEYMQNEIANMFDEEDLAFLYEQEIWVLTESITPVYYVDIMDYVNTGRWEVFPSGYKDGKYFAERNANETCVYKAKTTDYNGLFAGDITLLVMNKNVEIIDLVKKKTFNNVSLVSYADHRKRVEAGRKWWFVDESLNEITDCVRYVILGDFGSAFYVKKEVEIQEETFNMEYLVSLDSQRCIFGQKKGTVYQQDILHFDTDMPIVVDYLKGYIGSSDYYAPQSSKEFLPSENGTLNVISIADYMESGTCRFFTDRTKLIGYKEDQIPIESECTDFEVESESAVSHKKESLAFLGSVYLWIAIVFILIISFILFVRFYRQKNRN